MSYRYHYVKPPCAVSQESAYECLNQTLLMTLMSLVVRVKNLITV